MAELQAVISCRQPFVSTIVQDAIQKDSLRRPESEASCSSKDDAETEEAVNAILCNANEIAAENRQAQTPSPSTSSAAAEMHACFATVVVPSAEAHSSAIRAYQAHATAQADIDSRLAGSMMLPLASYGPASISQDLRHLSQQQQHPRPHHHLHYGHGAPHKKGSSPRNKAPPRLTPDLVSGTGGRSSNVRRGSSGSRSSGHLASPRDVPGRMNIEVSVVGSPFIYGSEAGGEEFGSDERNADERKIERHIVSRIPKIVSTESLAALDGCGSGGKSELFTATKGPGSNDSNVISRNTGGGNIDSVIEQCGLEKDSLMVDTRTMMLPSGVPPISPQINGSTTDTLQLHQQQRQHVTSFITSREKVLEQSQPQENCEEGDIVARALSCTLGNDINMSERFENHSPDAASSTSTESPDPTGNSAPVSRRRPSLSGISQPPKKRFHYSCASNNSDTDAVTGPPDAEPAPSTSSGSANSDAPPLLEPTTASTSTLKTPSNCFENSLKFAQQNTAASANPELDTAAALAAASAASQQHHDSAVMNNISSLLQQRSPTTSEERSPPRSTLSHESLSARSGSVSNMRNTSPGFLPLLRHPTPVEAMPSSSSSRVSQMARGLRLSAEQQQATTPLKLQQNQQQQFQATANSTVAGLAANYGQQSIALPGSSFTLVSPHQPISARQAPQYLYENLLGNGGSVAGFTNSVQQLQQQSMPMSFASPTVPMNHQSAMAAAAIGRWPAPQSVVKTQLQSPIATISTPRMPMLGSSQPAGQPMTTQNAQAAAAAAAHASLVSQQSLVMQETRNLPQGECFHLALSSWEWYTLDGTRLPCVFRNREKFLAVHMVQMRILAKFPPNVPPEIMQTHRMVSHKMSVLEAWIFNTVNAVHCKYEFGYQLFVPGDEVVNSTDVEKFYHAVKAFNLQRMIRIYRDEIRQNADLHLVLTAHISSLKHQSEADFQATERFLLGLGAVPLAIPGFSPSPTVAGGTQAGVNGFQIPGAAEAAEALAVSGFKPVNQRSSVSGGGAAGVSSVIQKGLNVLCSPVDNHQPLHPHSDRLPQSPKNAYLANPLLYHHQYPGAAAAQGMYHPHPHHNQGQHAAAAATLASLDVGLSSQNVAAADAVFQMAAANAMANAVVSDVAAARNSLAEYGCIGGAATFFDMAAAARFPTASVAHHAAGPQSHPHHMPHPDMRNFRLT